MIKLVDWHKWSITTKILFSFLALSVVAIAIIVYVALTNFDELGNHARDTSESLGKSAIEDSTAHLNRLGEELIRQKAQDVAKQVELYLSTNPLETDQALKQDTALRQIVVQPVGITGYTTLIDPISAAILIHKFGGQEKEVSSLREVLPSFWVLIESSKRGDVVAGYYAWLEVSGNITEKYACIAPVRTRDGRLLTLWATTYIEEFSQPAIETAGEINAGILASAQFIRDKVADIRYIFLIIFFSMVIIVTGLSLVLSRAITSPILSLRKGAEEIGRGELDYKLNLKSKDELGSLADSFNKMSADLKQYIRDLENTAAENIKKEKIIQYNLRTYVNKVNQAQEAERKRIARELHDETAQALVVVTRHLEELAARNPAHTADKIREEVREISRGIRRFSQELRPSILDDLGLIPAVQWLAGNMTENYGIAVKTEITGNKRQLPSETELILFRIIQEALTNVRKHAQSTEALVKVELEPNIVRVTVKDNGIGFDSTAAMVDLTRKGKLGLVGIHERVQLLGGKMNIKSIKKQGTEIQIEIPLEK